MADVESSFRTFVLQDVAVLAEVGERFYWNKVADKPTLPFVRGTTVTDKPNYTQDGDGTGITTIQLDVFHESKSECNRVAGLIKTRCSGYRGAMGDYYVRMFLRNIPSNWDESGRLFRRIVEVEVGYVT